ncbi:hypothetical protein JCM19000A_32690 [Silvimonas sp. JCM 19000]
MKKVVGGAMKDALELLENWALFVGGRVTNGFKGISLYLTPEEKAAMGPTCRESRCSEADAMRAEAIIATLRQSDLFRSFAVLLEKHFMYRANPSGTSRKLGLNINDYDAHVAKAVQIFSERWAMLEAVPTKAIRTCNLNNLLTAKKSATNLVATT